MRVAAWTFVVAGVALAIVRTAGASPVEDGPEGLVASAAYGAAVAAPGIVALVATRPLFVMAAGVGGAVVAMVASLGVTLPLLVPAVALVLAGARRRSPVGSVADGLAPGVVGALLPWGVLVLLVHADPAIWSTTTSGGGTSDIVVWWESLASLVVTTTAIGLARITPLPGVSRRGRGIAPSGRPPRSTVRR